MHRNELQVQRLGQPRAPFSDTYHLVHKMSWSSALYLFLSIFLVLNLIFAFLFGLGGDCIEGADPTHFLDRLFFSVQSFTTIGYGVMYPTTTYANILVSLESFIGIFFTALMTGVTFSRFSLPTTRVLFSKNALLSPRDGQPSFLFRLANGRGNSIVSVSLEATLFISDVTVEGESTRRLHRLEFTNPTIPLLTMSLSAIHVIDETSPFESLEMETLKKRDALVVVSLTGTDSTTGQRVHAQHFYRAGDFLCGVRFVNVLEASLVDGVMKYTLDYQKFHDVILVGNGSNEDL